MRLAVICFATDVVSEYCLWRSSGLLGDETRGAPPIAKQMNATRMPVCPPHERLFDWISHKTVAWWPQGGETTTRTLMTAVYFVLADEGDIFRRLWDETAVVKETMRISTLAARLARVAPTRPFDIKTEHCLRG
ncbi:hypothetical protein F4802DRAFT_602436 [Xylaria palmicola]|nr:hypothetical protein F4802DRAFT_602436 [Xylaria palmicola]